MSPGRSRRRDGVRVAATPPAPGWVGSTTGDAPVTINFDPPDGLVRFSPITGYVASCTDLTTPSNGTQTASVMTAGSVMVTDLVNGDHYNRGVAAVKRRRNRPRSTPASSRRPWSARRRPTCSSPITTPISCLKCRQQRRSLGDALYAGGMTGSAFQHRTRRHSDSRGCLRAFDNHLPGANDFRPQRPVRDLADQPLPRLRRGRRVHEPHQQTSARSWLTPAPSPTITTAGITNASA